MAGIDLLNISGGSDVVADLVDAKGDLIVGAADNDPDRFGVGADGAVLIADSTQTQGVRWGTVGGTGIPPETVNAKGDLLVGTADDTVARLAVGANNTVLVADSAQAGGMRWANELALASDSGERSLLVTSTGAVSTSESVGGAVTVSTTGSTGSGIIVYSNQAAPAAGARLLSVFADNAGFDQTMIVFKNDGIGTNTRLESNGTVSSNTVNTLTLVGGQNFDATTLGVSGYQDDLGTFKIVHNKPAGADTNAAAISILLDNPQASGSSAAQGIFLDTSNTGVGSSAHTTTAKLLNLRNAGTERLVLDAAGGLVSTRGSTGDNLILRNTAASRTGLVLDSIAAQQALVEFREAGTPQWQIGRQTGDDLFIWNNVVGTMATFSGATPSLAFTADPGVSSFTIGDTSLVTVDGGTINNRIWTDEADGATQSYDTKDGPGVRYNIEHGAAAAAYTGVDATVKVSRFGTATTDADHTGTHPSMWAAISAVSVGSSTTQAQPTAVTGVAASSSTTATSFPQDNPDATALIGIGLITGSGVGAGLGGYFEASLDGSHPSGQPHGQAIECSIRNQAADAVYSASGIGRSAALFLTTSGTFKPHSALSIGKSFTSDFLVGIFIANGSQGDAIQDASFRDEGNATYSLHVKGSHTSGALVIENTTGGFIEMIESTEPAAPANTRGRLYVVESGGATQLRFRTAAGITTIVPA